MNRTIKEATVRHYHSHTTDELNEYLQAFLLAYNHAKCLKTLRGLTPHEFDCTQWQKNPAIFTLDLTHLTLGTLREENECLHRRTLRISPNTLDKYLASG